MTCVDRYLSENYDHLYRLARKYVGEQYAGDLLNDMCLTHLSSDKAEALCERGELGRYINRSMQICGFSQTSPFYKKYKKHHEKETGNMPMDVLPAEDVQNNEEELEYQIQQVFTILHGVRWLDRELFKVYYLHEHSLNTLSNATGISKDTIYKSVKTAREYLQKNAARFRRHSGIHDSGEGQGCSREGRRRGLRLREKEAMAKQAVPLLPPLYRQGQKIMGGYAKAGHDAGTSGPEPTRGHD